MSTAWAARLASGEPIDAPVALVVAHPDDETLWTGAALARLAEAALIVLTDGAPEDMADARRLGFVSRTAYADHRAGELHRALDALAFTGQLIRYDIPDQATIERIDAVVERLRDDLADMACVITHPYEGGHPDHDAAALAVALTHPPATVEFACYARQAGERMFGRFVDHPAAAEQRRRLSPADRMRVDGALAAHASQSAVFGEWRPEVERWRLAPVYRFDRPPPGEACLYDDFGWSMTSDRWRALAARALALA